MILKFKFKQVRFIFVFLLLLVCLLIAGGNFQYKDDTMDKEEKFKMSEAPLYHLEWSKINSTLGPINDIVRSNSGDIYAVCEGYGKGNKLVKYDSNGNFEWEISRDGIFSSIILDSSNNIYVAGKKNNNMLLEKFTSEGTLLWSKARYVREYDYIRDVAVDTGDNPYIAGGSYNTDPYVEKNQDIILVKYSSSGTFQWDSVLDIEEEDSCDGLVTDSSDDVYLCGYHGDFGPRPDAFIAKYNSDGNLQWRTDYGDASQENYFEDITIDSSRNIYVTGYIEDWTQTEGDMCLLKFNNAGNLQWSRIWGGDGLDCGKSITLSPDGDIFITGYTPGSSSSDVLLAVYSPLGILKGWNQWGGNRNDRGYSIVINSLKQVYIGGYLGDNSLTDDDFCILKYDLAPNITINYPTVDSLYSNLPPNYNVEITDSNLVEKYYTVNDEINYPFTESTGTINQTAWDLCSDGNVSLKFYGRDPSGAVYKEVIVRKDTLAPDFDIISPSPLNVFTDTAPNFLLNTNSTDVNKIWYTLNGGEDIVANGFTGKIDQSAWNVLDNGSIMIEYFMEDNIGNVDSKVVEVYKNYENPLIVISSPSFNQFYGLNAPEYDISVNSLWTTTEMWYSVNNGTNITITQMEGKISQNDWDLCANGTVRLNFYVKNSLGNIGNTEVVVRKDIYFPFIEINKPLIGQRYGISAPDYNVSITSTILDSKWYSLNGGINYTFSGLNGTINQTAWDTCENGTVTITFYANNSNGITSLEEISIIKDTKTPIITIITPTSDKLYGLETIDFSLSINDPELDQTWYSLNGGINYTFSKLSGTIDQAAWDSCENGSVIITFYANNTLGNLGKTELNVRKDVFYPFLTIISPVSEKLYGITGPDYDILISTLDNVSMWYTLNAGQKFIILTTSGKIDQSYWDSIITQKVNVTFYVNNSFGQINSKKVEVSKDTTTPSITIFSPQPNDLYGIDTIEFNVTIDDPNLESSWYTLNGGDKFFFTGNVGYIDKSAWEVCDNGTITITFFANNSLNNIGSKQVTIHRDIYLPFIEIHKPLNNQLTGPSSPYYNISISSSAIDTIWYVLNSSVKHTIVSQNGRIDQSKWDMFGAGFISITFCANNTYGQVNSNQVIVEKKLELIEKNAYAIVVGISDYPGTSYDLSYCDDDAIGVYNMLINDYNFKPENIIYLQDSSATKNEINNAINTIKSLISEDDIFLFYYSGHGGHGIYSTQGSWNVESLHPYWDNYDQIWSVSHPGALYMRVHFERFQTEDFYDYALCGGWDVTRGYYYEKLSGNLGYNFWSSYIPVSRYYLRFFSDDSITNYGFKIDKYEAIMEDGTHYLCSFDSIPNNPSAYYTDTLLDQKLDSIICSDKYIILDSCNSGGIIPEVQDIGRYIMTACRGTEESLETPSLEHGIFTNFLLESKENANDENSDGVISIEECYSYVHSKTRSYSGSFGSEYRYSPQESDGINGEAVLYPAIGGVTLNRIGNQLSYSFTLYGHGKIKVLNMTVCSVYPDYQFKTINLKNIIFSPTGFGYYNGIVEFAPGYIPYGVQFYAEIEGSQTLIINFTYGDYDGDGLDDIFEISQGIGLDPCLNDTDSDGLNDYDEFYGNTNPVDNDSDNDGLLDGDEINLYGTDPINSDSDNDGLLDGDEINLYGTDPINSDSDNDGLLDGEEVNLYGSDPMDNDSDIDGLSDGDEINIYLTNPIINDTDSDNLSDGEEVNLYGTNPIEADSDFDKINDFDEIFVYNTDPLKEDSDGDNLNDMDEIVTYGTDPLNNDTDFDLITDGYEVLYGLNPLEDDSNLDPDSDLLNNLEEFIHLTDPHLNDTDSDYLLDGEEIKSYGTSPINEDSDFDNLSDGLEVLIYETDPLMIDTDSDGLSDGDEVLIHGTNPLSEDSDSDAMPDEWEVLNLTDPLINDTKCDPDSDGLLNIQEYNLSCNPQDPDTDDDGWLDGDEVNTYGTDPLDPNSHPNPSTSTIPGYNFSIIFSLSLITFIVILWKYKKHQF